MLYLILAILSSMLVSVLMRLSGKFSKNGMTMLAANYAMCTVAALALVNDALNPYVADITAEDMDVLVP